ncbi:Hsp20/alpha crystallin family protein [Dictyocaulus viviparus]|uniref:Hsp20/alpha crystallin family protein n=1 Tax=Dictyocaulus viviparus TaxID=29172 RepID=A0A0D8Y8W0_DICVI|nr:Hsp20/alpha crystallin family protein [Dictyocaulus viviparus]
MQTIRNVTCTKGTVENCVRNLGSCILSYWGMIEQDNTRANDEHEVINDSTKFVISLDVSQFKPEELRVHLNGRDVLIEGNQEKSSDIGYVQKSFIKRCTLPDDADLDAIETNLNDLGRLLIETPKTGLHTFRREIPIKLNATITSKFEKGVIIIEPKN